MASPSPAGASVGTQASRAASTASSSRSDQVSKSALFIGCVWPGRPGSWVRPWLELAVFEDLHLLLDGLEPGAAELQQRGAAPIAFEQAFEGQLATFHRGNKRFQLCQRSLVIRGRRRAPGGCGGYRHSAA